MASSSKLNGASHSGLSSRCQPREPLPRVAPNAFATQFVKARRCRKTSALRTAQPAASVVDNDLALRRVGEAVYHSPYWDDTASDVLEDDAQDRADHVDAHRSIAFVVSKYSPGSTADACVDSRFYTTVNMVHTIE